MLLWLLQISCGDVAAVNESFHYLNENAPFVTFCISGASAHNLSSSSLKGFHLFDDYKNGNIGSLLEHYSTVQGRLVSFV